jgi:ABC-type polysaccharide/polyol phosphate transport system ATPase subunit
MSSDNTTPDTTEYAIEVNALSKCYQIYDKPSDRLKQMLMRGRKQYYKEFWALKDVSFKIKKGETVGIIGRNGSGKSTLLQMICGTLNPTGGEVKVNGRVAALLELGAGFNPEFSGVENVYMAASLYGLSKEEVDQRFEAIATFAEIGDHIHQPVKTYSSGMYVRLAFAVIAHVDADILVVDEALAVGDAVFTQKCRGQGGLDEVANLGRHIPTGVPLATAVNIEPKHTYRCGAQNHRNQAMSKRDHAAIISRKGTASRTWVRNEYVRFKTDTAMPESAYQQAQIPTSRPTVKLAESRHNEIRSCTELPPNIILLQNYPISSERIASINAITQQLGSGGTACERARRASLSGGGDARRHRRQHPSCSAQTDVPGSSVPVQVVRPLAEPEPSRDTVARTEV